MWRKSPNTIEVRVSTTHPAMSKLFLRAFRKYGHLMRFAEPAYLPSHFRWQIKAHLDRTFDFLVAKPTITPVQFKEFYRFLAGYSDCECCWSVYLKARRIRVSWVVETLDAQLVRQISNKLKADGFHPLLYLRVQSGFTKKNQDAYLGKRAKLRLVLNRSSEVVALAKLLKPHSLHSEKTAKMNLIIAHSQGKWSEVATSVRQLRRRTRKRVTQYTMEAERTYNSQRTRPSRIGVVG